jgi:hypothetical protein
MARAATSECPVCHYRYDKPEMHKRSIQVRGGKSGFSASFSPFRKNIVKSIRVNSGRRYYRKKTVFICSGCIDDFDNSGKGFISSFLGTIFSFLWFIFLIGLAISFIAFLTSLAPTSGPTSNRDDTFPQTGQHLPEPEEPLFQPELPSPEPRGPSFEEPFQRFN